MSISRIQNEAENRRRWAEEKELADLRAENVQLRAGLRAVVACVRDDIVPIIEMSDEAKEVGTDLYVALHQLKEMLAALDPAPAEGSGSGGERA